MERVAEHLATVEAGRASRLGRHIAGCPDCSQAAAGLTETARLVSGAGMVSPPEGMWEKIAPRLPDKPDRTRQRPRPVLTRRGMLAAVATVIVAVAVILQTHPQAQRTPLDPDMEAFFERYSSIQPAEAGTGITTGRLRSFEKSANMTVRLPRSLASGWRLVKVERFTCSGGRPVAHLAYARDGQTLSVFEKPLGGGPGMGMGRGRGRGHGGMRGRGVCRVYSSNAAFSTDGTHRYVVMGDLSPEALQAVADDLAAQ